MPDPRRPPGVEPTAELRKVWVDVTENGVHFRFHDGSGVGLSRDNVDYFRVIGEWFVREVDAMPTVERCEHGVITGDYCEPCNQAYKLARVENGDDA